MRVFVVLLQNGLIDFDEIFMCTMGLAVAVPGMWRALGLHALFINILYSNGFLLVRIK